MNSLEHFFCSTSLWRGMTRRYLVPWMLDGVPLGDHVLEIGAGYGAATAELLKRAPQVTSLEYDPRLLQKLQAAHLDPRLTSLRGDATSLPFAEASFSSVIAILVLHHLQSRDLQDRAMAEAHRVLRPGGSFFAMEISDGWWHRLIHYKSSFVPVDPASAFARLTSAGFRRVSVDFRSNGFRLRARKAAEEPVKQQAPAASSATA
jgi:SAM-dependent methyltransferase